MKKNLKKTLSSVAGLSMLAAQALPAVAEEVTIEQNGYTVTVSEGQEAACTAVANVAGEFSFNQDVLSPSDDIFSIFGTAVTGICAKPAFAISGAQENVENHYVNVYGNMKFNFSVSLDELKDKEVTHTMTCSCATGAAIINASVTGVPLSAILEAAELDPGANVLKAKGSDGYGLAMPLSYAMDHRAMLVYKINGQPLPENQNTQLWMPGTVAQYFTRDVVDLEITAEETVPEVKTAEDAYRAKISITNYFGDATVPAGQPVTFEGYADDFGTPITAIEFSMDNGATWTTCETKDATADKWVYWYFTHTPETAGTYKLSVRAVAADGTISPLASSLVFSVTK